MSPLRLKIGILMTASVVLAEDLPLPQSGGLPSFGPQPFVEQGGLVKPSAVIKVPVSTPITVPEEVKMPQMRMPSEAAAEPQMQVPLLMPAQEFAILETERQLVEEQVRRQIAEAHEGGYASLLKQIILMGGPVDTSVSRAAMPPTVPEGQLALIGLEEGAVVGKNLEQFFGAPMTPAQEKALLKAVKTQLAGKDKPRMDVRIAGWWPDQGVMAVSVVPDEG